MKYIPYKDKKAFVADLKAVYGSVNEDAALENLQYAKEKWGKKYPTAIKSWEDNWDLVVNQLNIIFGDVLKKEA